MAADDKTVWTALRLHHADNVATALRDLPAGGSPHISDCPAPALCTDIARGHKFALSPIAAGEQAIKYGQAVGVALSDIAAGEHVHLHNLEGLAGRAERHRNAS
ncbi:MAG: UxaA family hydrolase [Hyphomicrobiaceae bacterium]